MLQLRAHAELTEEVNEIYEGRCVFVLELPLGQDVLQLRLSCQLGPVRERNFVGDQQAN
jgi:hypothetical protein